MTWAKPDVKQDERYCVSPPDDLKLYADSDANLNKLIQIVHDFSTDICMDFGLDK